jgi:hypothetical protein
MGESYNKQQAEQALADLEENYVKMTKMRFDVERSLAASSPEDFESWEKLLNTTLMAAREHTVTIALAKKYLETFDDN